MKPLAPLLAAVASGALLALAFPPWNLWLWAWVALLPLALATVILPTPNANPREDSKLPTSDPQTRLGFGAGRLKSLWHLGLRMWGFPFRLGFVAGFIFWLMTLHWLLWLGTTAEGIPRWLAWVFAVFAWTSVSTVCAIYLGIWTCGLRALAGRFDISTAMGSLVFATLGSCLWVGLEFLRAHLWVGFPWNQLGVSSWRTIVLVQMAEWLGVYGISFLLCFSNLALAALTAAVASGRFWPRAQALCAAGTGVVLLVLALRGGATLGADHSHQEVARSRAWVVAVVQGNIAQNEKWRAANAEEILRTYADLTRKAMLAGPHLVVWPETSTPRLLNFDRQTYDTVGALAREGNSFLLVGTSDAETQEGTGEVLRWGNAAYLMGPDGRFAARPYWKIRLVPFGEYIPLSGVAPPLKNLAGLPMLSPGSDYRVFPLQTLSFVPSEEGQGEKRASARFGVLICFEDVFSSSARRLVREGAEFLVNLTNDAWWGRSAGAKQHAANAVFRAVENRVWLVRATNTGLSGFVNPAGRLAQTLPLWEAGFAAQPIILGTRHLTFYTKYGDVFAFACLAVVAVWLAAEGIAYARKRPPNLAERR